MVPATKRAQQLDRVDISEEIGNDRTRMLNLLAKYASHPLLSPHGAYLGQGPKFDLPEVNMMRWSQNKNRPNLRGIHMGVRKRCSLCGIAAWAGRV